MELPHPGEPRPLLGLLGVLVLAGLLAVPAPGPWTALVTALVAFVVGLSDDGARRGALAFLLAVAAVAVLVLAGVADPGGATREMLFAFARGGVPWLAGRAWRLRTQVRDQAVERLAQEARARRASARRRRDAERLALAETLHDDLGHDLSLVALNLGRLELDPDLPGPARESVAAARRQLARAVEGLGASVSSLRSGTDAEPARRDDVAGLLDRARRAGAEVDATGLADDLPDAVDRETLVRVLQEGLTNAVKHAPGQPVRVAATGDGWLDVTVRNAVAPGGPGGTVSGTGLATLGRRLAALGGTLSGAQEGGQFVLRAKIPPSADAVHDPDEELDGPQDVARDAALLGRARRRGRAVLAAAVAATVAVLGAVEAVTVLEARRALLPAADFSRIQVGDARDDVAALLPEDELPRRSDTTGGPDCHDYALTADPFDDASGDVYRVCFAADVVVSARHVAGEDR